MQELIIGLGSNLGDRQKSMEIAINRIEKEIGPVVRASSFLETEPWGFESGNLFLNCAIMVEDESPSGSSLSLRMHQLIKILQSIEADFGRIRTGVYADRPMDLDILFYGDQIVKEPGLVIPHPRLHERDFILSSLMEICPDKMHPVIGLTIRQLYQK